MNSYAYILKCSDNTYYVGSTGSIQSRLKRHNEERGGEYTSRRIPCVLVWCQKFCNSQDASKKEKEVKKFSRFKKENLIFSANSVWKHHKGRKYIILCLIGNLILYTELKKWQVYKNKQDQKGEQCPVWLRDKNQWLDWISKENKLLRFNLICG